MFIYNYINKYATKKFNLFSVGRQHFQIGGTATVALIKKISILSRIGMGVAVPLGETGTSRSFSLKVEISISKTASMILLLATILFRMLNLLNFFSTNKAKWSILVDFSSGGSCVINSAHLGSSSNFLSAIDFLRVVFFRGGSFSGTEIEHSKSSPSKSKPSLFFRWSQNKS